MDKERADMSSTIVLKGAHVIDPDQGIDRVTDVVIENGRIKSIGTPEPVEGQEIIDLHVHAYGTLGFSNPDTIGVYQGVTSFVEAGGPGIGTLGEFTALMEGLETSLYVGPFIRPMGLLGLNYIEGDVRTLGAVPINEWLDYATAHGDTMRYLKCNAIGDYGPGTLNLTKGMAQILGKPLYMHIGEFQFQTPEHLLAPEAFKVADAGDMITHIYHGNLGQIIDDAGKILPVVRDAERRGVLFDLGFGSYNFSWHVAETAFAQGVLPYTISSDLQQYNVVRPVKSLANVLSVMLHLGLTLQDAMARVTINPARALSLTDRAGRLAAGLPADITVFRVDSGAFELSDCFKQTRTADRQIVPVMAFKNGKRFDCAMTLGQDESNWFLQFAEDHVPAAAHALTAVQRAFLDDLAATLTPIHWHMPTNEQLDLDKALLLQATFHDVRARHPLSLRDALHATYDCFLDNRFTMQIGLLLARLEKPFALERLRQVAGRQTVAA
jgi:dihydroorotase